MPMLLHTLPSRRRRRWRARVLRTRIAVATSLILLTAYAAWPSKDAMQQASDPAGTFPQTVVAAPMQSIDSEGMRSDADQASDAAQDVGDH
jgi:hypothetical protein